MPTVNDYQFMMLPTAYPIIMHTYDRNGSGAQLSPYLLPTEETSQAMRFGILPEWAIELSDMIATLAGRDARGIA